MSGTREPSTSAAHDESLTLLQRRVRSEFLEMPGLRLTPAQASRLWAVDRATSADVLDRLADAGFLSRGRGGAYVRASAE